VVTGMFYLPLGEMVVACTTVRSSGHSMRSRIGRNRAPDGLPNLR
jgi:hypothetical protein